MVLHCPPPFKQRNCKLISWNSWVLIMGPRNTVTTNVCRLLTQAKTLKCVTQQTDRQTSGWTNGMTNRLTDEDREVIPVWQSIYADDTKGGCREISDFTYQQSTEIS